MRKHNKFASRLLAAMETMELRRLLSTVTGTVFDDWDLNGRLSVGEPGKAGRIVYADYNYNSTLDAAEPRSLTNDAGNYSLDTRAQNVELRVVTYASEEITLGYGATSIWLPAVNGTVTGRNFGIWYPTNTASVSGSVFADTNRNGRRDAGEAGLAGRTVFADYNYNGRFDTGDIPTTTDASGNYKLFSVRTSGLQLGVVTGAEESISLPYGATTLWIGELLGLGVSGKNLGVVTNTPMNHVTGTFYSDTNSNLRYDEGDQGLAGRTVYADYNYNGVLDANEPSAVSDANGHYTLSTRPEHVDIRAIVRDDELLAGANHHWIPTVNGTVTGRNFRVFTPTSPIYTSASVIFDANGDGLVHWSEPGVAGLSVFADYNANGTLDANEPVGITDLNGIALFTVTQRRFDVYLMPSNDYIQTSPDGAFPIDLSSGSGIGAQFLVVRNVSASVTGTVYFDTNRNSRKDTGEVGLANRTVFADYNFNGVLDADEPRAFTDASGFYSLATRPQNVQLSLVTLPGEQITLGYGATSIWLSTVNGTLSGKNFGLVLHTTSTISGSVYLDLNGNGQRDQMDQFSNLNVIVFVDLDNDGYWGGNGAVEPGVTASLVDGSYTITGVPAGIDVVLRAIYTGGDRTPPMVFSEPGTWNDPARTLHTVAGVNAGGNFGLTQQNVGFISAYAFDDVDGNGEFNSYEQNTQAQSVWIDLNANNLLDSGEPQLNVGFYGSTQAPRRYYYVAAPHGQWRVAIRFQGDTDNVADLYRTVNLSAPGTGLVYLGRPVIASISGSVFGDANGNGRLDAGESGLAGRRVFVDANFDGALDSGETWTSTDANGAYTLVPSSYRLVNVRLALKAGESLSIGSTGYWFSDLSGPFTGRNFGVVM